MLRERNWFLFVLAFAYLATLELLSWWTSKLPPCAIPSQYQRSNYQADQNACATFAEGSIQFVSFLWLKTGHNEILGFGTLLIAVFTFTLWRSTRNLWVATNRAAEAQAADTRILQRAYISVEIGGIHKFLDIAWSEQCTHQTITDFRHRLHHLWAHRGHVDRNRRPGKGSPLPRIHRRRRHLVVHAFKRLRIAGLQIVPTGANGLHEFLEL